MASGGGCKLLPIGISDLSKVKKQSNPVPCKNKLLKFRTEHNVFCVFRCTLTDFISLKIYYL